MAVHSRPASPSGGSDSDECSAEESSSLADIQASMIIALHNYASNEEKLKEQLIAMYHSWLSVAPTALGESLDDALGDPLLQRLQHFLDTILYSLAPVDAQGSSGTAKDSSSILVETASKWCQSLPNSKGAKCRCDAVWYVADGRETIAYGCKTCGLSSASCICVACFDAGEHEGHDFFISRSDYGCCDCGDAYAWRPEGFCKKHTGPLPDVDPADALPSVTRAILPTAIGVVCNILLGMIHETVTVGDPQSISNMRSSQTVLDDEVSIILQWLMDLSTLHDGLRRSTAKSILKSEALRYDKESEKMVHFKFEMKGIEEGGRHGTIIEALLTTLHKLGIKGRKALTNFIVDQMLDLTFKHDFSILFVRLYHDLALARTSPAKDKGLLLAASTVADIQRHSELGDFTCQMFTRKDVTVMLATEYDILGTILRTARDMLRRAIMRERIDEETAIYQGVDVRHAIIKKHELTQCTMDLLYVLDHDEVHSVIMENDGQMMKEVVVPGWCALLKLAQFCYPKKVQRGNHVEFSDPDWTGALSLHTDVVSHSWILIDIIYRYGSIDLCRELLLQVRRVLKEWQGAPAVEMGAIEALPNKKSTLSRPFTWSDTHDLLCKVKVGSKRWNSNEDLCSMHVPLSRLYVVLYTVTLHKYGLAGIPEEIHGDFEVARLLEFPLRALVQHEEVCSGLWIRNGDSTRSEHEFYLANYFHHSFADVDIQAVLLTSRLCAEPGRFVKHLLSTFGIRPTVAWSEHIPPLSATSVEEGERYVKKLNCAMKILCALVSPYSSGITEAGGRQYTDITSKQHLRQKLAAAGQITMSYARDPRLDKFTNTLAASDMDLLQENLEAVAKPELGGTNTAGQRSLYTLRDDQWGLVDLLYPSWVWREQQDVEERLVSYLKREHKTLTDWWFDEVIYNPDRPKVHEDLRKPTAQLIESRELLSICFISLLAVKVGLLDTLGGDQRLLHLTLHLLLRVVTLSIGVEEMQDGQDEQMSSIDEDAFESSTYNFQAFTVPQLARRYKAVGSEPRSGNCAILKCCLHRIVIPVGLPGGAQIEAGQSESILSLLASLALKPSCSQEYPWIELLLNSLHRSAYNNTTRAEIETSMVSANMTIPSNTVEYPSTPVRKKSTNFVATVDEADNGNTSEAERLKRHRCDSSFSGSSPIDPAKMRKRRSVQRKMLNLVQMRQQQFLEGIAGKGTSPSITPKGRSRAQSATMGGECDSTCVICFGGNPEPSVASQASTDSPTVISGALGRLCFVEVSTFTDTPRPKMPTDEAILPFEEVGASPRRHSASLGDSHERQPTMTFFTPGPTSMKAVIHGCGHLLHTKCWESYRENAIGNLSCPYCNRPCNVLLPPSEDMNIPEPPMATSFDDCPISASRFGLECMQNLVEVLPALQGGMDVAQWEESHFNEHISPRYADTVRAVCFVVAGAVEAYSRQISSDPTNSSWSRSWHWLLSGLVGSAKKLTSGPSRVHLRELCNQMWMAPNCRPYIALSPCYRWFALVMSLVIDGDSDEKFQSYIVRALLYESAASVRQVKHEIGSMPPNDSLPNVLRDLVAIGTTDLLRKILCFLYVIGREDVVLPSALGKYDSVSFDELLSRLPNGIGEAYKKKSEDFEFESIDYESEVSREAQKQTGVLSSATLSDYSSIALSLRAGLVSQCSSTLIYFLVPCNMDEIDDCEQQQEGIPSVTRDAFEAISDHHFVVKLYSREQMDDYMKVHKIPGFVTVMPPFTFDGDEFTLEAVPYRAGAILLDWPKVYQRIYTQFVNHRCVRCRSVPRLSTVCLICGAYLCCNSECCRLTIRGAEPIGPGRDLIAPDGIVQKMGEVSAHALRCGLGTCVFLQLGNSVVHVIASGAKRIALWGSLHLDAFGEEDYTQSKPIRLDLETRLPRLAGAIRDYNFLWKHGKLEWKQIVFV